MRKRFHAFSFALWGVLFLFLIGSVTRLFAQEKAPQLDASYFKKLSDAGERIRTVKEHLASLNKLMNDAGMPHVNPDLVTPPPSGRGRFGEE